MKEVVGIDEGPLLLRRRRWLASMKDRSFSDEGGDWHG
jgi:hypothetical protein